MFVFTDYSCLFRFDSDFAALRDSFGGRLYVRQREHRIRRNKGGYESVTSLCSSFETVFLWNSRSGG